MRCFIAIDIDEQIKKLLSDLQQQLQSKADINNDAVKWVRREAMHLTLKFLGEVKDKNIAEVCNIAKEIASRHEGFELDIESVGYFGGSSARVLWVGTGDGGDHLYRLANDLEQRLAAAGWPEEKRDFAGHLTLCRIKNSSAGVRLAQVSSDYKDFKVGTVSVDSVSVYHSQLRSTGPVYTVLGNYKLAGRKS